MSNRPGFISVTGIVVAVVLISGLVGWTMIDGPVLFSPGALNAQSKSQKSYGGIMNHAQLKGDCNVCHSAPWSSQSMTDRCIWCHTEVSTQVQTKTGLHGILVGTLKSPTCRGCHTEHHGAAGALTVVDPKTFPHDLTGYSLRAHQRKSDGSQFLCADCHPKGVSSFDQATCQNCHATIDAAFMTQHVNDFGTQCLECHKGNDPFANFKHTFFPLNHGREERQATCKTCHPTNAFSKYTCYGCHEHTPANVLNDHEGRPLSQLTDCVKCHPQGRNAD